MPLLLIAFILKIAIILGMEYGATLLSASLGRRPSANPKSATLGVRVDLEMLAHIDAEIREIAKERRGLIVTRADVVRMWVAEAIERRTRKK